MKRRIKVLFVFPVAQVWGGESVWLKFLSRLNRDKYEAVCLIFGHGDLVDRIKRLGFKCFNLEKRKLRNLYWTVVNFFKIINILKREGFDSIHALGVHFLSFSASLLLDIPFCFHIHTVHPLPFLDRWCLRRARYIATSSNFSKKFLIGYGVKEPVVDVIPNGIDPQAIRNADPKISIRREYALGEMPVICYIGRIVPWKNLEILIRTIPVIKEGYDGPFKVLMIGNAPRLKSKEKGYDAHLLNLARHLGCEDDVIFCGRREDVPSILKEIDIFVMPSLIEVCSMSILEAMCLKKPVVAMRSGGNEEMLTVGGVLVDPASSHIGLAQAIAGLLRDRQKRERLPDLSLDRVEGFYSLSKNYKTFDRLIEKVCLASGNTLLWMISNEVFPGSKILSLKVFKRSGGNRLIALKIKKSDKAIQMLWIKNYVLFFSDFEKERMQAAEKYDFMVSLYNSFKDDVFLKVIKPVAFISDYAATVTEHSEGRILKSWIIGRCLFFNPFFSLNTGKFLFLCGRMLARFQKETADKIDKFVFAPFYDQKGIEYDMSLAENVISPGSLEKLRSYFARESAYVKEHSSSVSVMHPDLGARNLLIDGRGSLTLLDFDCLQARISLEAVAMFLSRLELYLRQPFVGFKRIQILKESLIKGYEEGSGKPVDMRCLRFWEARYLLASLAGEVYFLNLKNKFYRKFMFKRSKRIFDRWVKREING
ncbi:MAG TPA: glycosyltransferase family 4 protein [Candidatus Omnitrophota bacterium]|nr:glycosyltransferase family 4 protein [Candidatus Omnitrophota bacterium]